MKCSYQIGSNLDQSKRVSKLVKRGDQYPCAGEGALFQRVPLPITSRTDSKKGTRDDQLSHYSLEGGDLGGYRTQGLMCH